jgi:hypothetical protein
VDVIYNKTRSEQLAKSFRHLAEAKMGSGEKLETQSPIQSQSQNRNLIQSQSQNQIQTSTKLLEISLGTELV